MKTCVLLLLVVGCVYGAPVGNGGLEPGSCEDASAVNAAHQALSKINLDRTEGYIFTLQRLSDVHLAKNGETGVVYYLTLDVVETNCSVLSRKDWKICQARPAPTAQVYGQCKAAIYISKPHRVVRLYKYKCLIRPVPSARVHEICPDCPTFIGEDNDQVKKAVTLSLEKFNKEKGLKNHFALLRVARATVGMAMHMYYNVEYSIQETSCNSSTDAATVDKCPIMTCEFAHKGFCKASLFYISNDKTDVTVECEIFEPEAAEAEKVQHLLGDKTSHSHNDTHRHEHGKGHNNGHGHGHDHSHGKGNNRTHSHDHSHENDHDHGHHHDHGKKNNRTHSHDHSHGNDHDHGHHHDHGKKNNRTHSHDHSHENDHGKKNNRTHSHGHDHGKGHRHHSRFNNRTSPHDHLHDHTKDHSHHVQEHPADSDHHHTHDHKPGSAHRHSHAHSHDHGINHALEHVHAYHSQAYDHSGDSPNHHHDYKHEEGTHTHEHDHELALDHDHKHGHLHEYEHHHHHHEHVHENEVHDQPEGLLKKIGAIGQPITAPIFPEEPPKAVILLLKIDPQIPGVPEPNILDFPATGSAQCVAPTTGKTLVEKLFIEDNLFKPGNNF